MHAIVGVFVGVAVGVLVGLKVLVGVAVNVLDGLAVTVLVGRIVWVGVAVWIVVTVGDGVALWDGAVVGVALGTAEAVAIGVKVGDVVAVLVAESVMRHFKSLVQSFKDLEVAQQFLDSGGCPSGRVKVAISCIRLSDLTHPVGSYNDLLDSNVWKLLAGERVHTIGDLVMLYPEIKNRAVDQNIDLSTLTKMLVAFGFEAELANSVL